MAVKAKMDLCGSAQSGVQLRVEGSLRCTCESAFECVRVVLEVYCEWGMSVHYLIPLDRGLVRRGCYVA